jgi:HD-GYP domain-containing protein (c-di-GMP phosphodiesterase class II)
LTLAKDLRVLVHVPKDSLKRGMFIESVECPDTEFAKRRFVLKAPEDLQAILSSSAERVLINTAIGESGSPAKLASNSQYRPADIGKATREIVANVVSTSTAALRESFGLIRSGQAPDLDVLTPIAETIADLADDAPVVFLEMTRLRTKDVGTYLHCLSVGTLMTQIGRLLDLEHGNVVELGLAGLLHDIGKLRIPDAILKKSGTLSDSERQMIRSHPERGFALLKENPEVPPMVLEVCRLHHEYLDGSGYPLGLKAPNISLPVRICTICDVFDALTTRRPYKKPWSSKAAIAWMFARESHFDKKLVLRLDQIITPRVIS